MELYAVVTCIHICIDFFLLFVDIYIYLFIYVFIYIYIIHTCVIQAPQKMPGPKTTHSPFFPTVARAHIYRRFVVPGSFKSADVRFF